MLAVRCSGRGDVGACRRNGVGLLCLVLWSLLHVGVLRPVGAEARSDHVLRATWGSLGGDALGTLPCLHSPQLSWLGACDP